MTARPAVHPGEALVSLGLIVLGTFVVWETRGIVEMQTAAQIGPRLFPYLIGAGLTICGAVLGWQAVSGGWHHVALDDAHDERDRVAFGIVSGGIVLHMVLIGWAGFMIASTVLFVLIARGFGSRRALRDLGIGALLAAATYAVFTYGLGLALPAGPFG